jgi:tetratricopeptide (TPR) repeat protein
VTTAVLLLGTLNSPAGGATRVIVIGVEKYAAVGNKQPNPVSFAENDARLFTDFSVKKGLDPKPITLDSRATLPVIQFELNRVLEQARPADTVYIFVSARGVARPGLDGYLGTANMDMEKPESGGLPVQYLRRLIQGSSAARIILFADVCRRPAEPFSNQINKRVAELGDITRPAVAGVLASQPGQTSEERADNQYKPGYGLFGFFLVNSGAAGTSGVPGISSELLKNLAEATKGKQKPSDFGAGPAKSAPLWRARLELRPVEPRFHFPRLPFQIASTAWFDGLFDPQTPASVSGLNSIRDELNNLATHVDDPAGLARRLLAVKDQAPAEDWNEVDALAVTRLASDGQRVVDRYGMDSLLPDDPLKVTPDVAARAAREFAAASMLTPTGDSYRDFRQSLEVRQRLCEGLAGVIPDIGPLQAAHGSSAAIPELHNAIGIYYLESRNKDYREAIREFGEAKSASPGWMYPRHNLALAYIENGDYTAAEREYREAIASNPLQPYLYYNQGLLLHRMNRRADANAAYDKALDVYKNTIAELRAHAAEWRSVSPDEAVLAERRAQIYEKGRAEVMNARGALLASEGREKPARQDYLGAIEADPDLCPARDNLAAMEQAAAERRNKTAVSDVAVQKLNENLARPSCASFFPSFLMRARLKQKSGDFSGARADFSEVRKLVPANTEAIGGMAAIDFANGQFSSAVSLFTEAISMQTKTGSMAYPALYVELAETYRKSGNAELCRQAYAEAIQAAKGAAYGTSVRELRKRASCASERIIR